MTNSVENAKDQIAKEIKEHSIVLYMKGNKIAPQCGFSAQVVQILMNLNANFETRDVLQDDALRQGIKEFTDWPTVPQLYVNGEFIGGCDIITELYETGELADILAK